MEYLVVDTGKLYHHKMRLDSVLRKPKVTREDVLNYIKTKHHLYFVSGKVKDAQLFKFIDKLLVRKGIITKTELTTLQNNYTQQAKAQKQDIVSNNASDDFDYLNDEEEEEYYEEDYEDYEDATNFVNQKKKELPTKETAKAPDKKNAFLAYCQEYEDGDEEAEGHAEWDLDMD